MKNLAKIFLFTAVFFTVTFGFVGFIGADHEFVAKEETQKRYLISTTPIEFTMSELVLTAEVKEVKIQSVRNTVPITYTKKVIDGKVTVDHFYSQVQLLDENGNTLADWFPLQ